MGSGILPENIVGEHNPPCHTVVNMALSQLFWDVFMPWNLKSTYFSLKMIHFRSLNIWYVIYVVFWIKYWNLKLPHHCILFLFTICTVSQLFWNRVCRQKTYSFGTISKLCKWWQNFHFWLNYPFSVVQNCILHFMKNPLIDLILSLFYFHSVFSYCFIKITCI